MQEKSWTPELMVELASNLIIKWMLLVDRWAELVISHICCASVTKRMTFAFMSWLLQTRIIYSFIRDHSNQMVYRVQLPGVDCSMLENVSFWLKSTLYVYRFQSQYFGSMRWNGAWTYIGQTGTIWWLTSGSEVTDTTASNTTNDLATQERRRNLTYI